MFEGYKDLFGFLGNLAEADTPEDIAACAYSDIIDDVSMTLVDYRMQYNMSQVDLAKKLSISQAMISQYESGSRNISLQTLCALMAKLGKKVVLSFENIAESSVCIPVLDPVIELTNDVECELALCA